MKFLASGWQYKTFDLENGRVKKVPHFSISALFILFFLPGTPEFLSIRRTFKELKRLREVAKSSVRGVRAVLVDPTLIGNPIVSGNRSYEQNKALPLGKFFKTHTLSENKEKVDAYINLVFALWQSGFSDSVYNFTTNNAVSDDGTVILIDLGELSFSKEEVANDVRRQVWLVRWSYKKDLKDLALKKYFAEQMAKYLTLENLDKHWRKRKRSA